VTEGIFSLSQTKAFDCYIIRRVVRKVTQTTEDLYTAYRSDVYRFVYMMTGNRAVSEDVTQDVFLYAIEKDKNGHTNPRAWLLTAARTRTLNLLKREKRSAPLSEDFAYQDSSDLHFLDPPASARLLYAISSTACRIPIPQRY
jgi:DNA-directed RNA polymerase specialized sigma24 family protein